MSELALLLFLFVGPMLVACSSESRFIWGTAHDLAFIRTTGEISSVTDVLQDEPWLLTGYAIDFDNELDRTIAVAVIKAHQAGEDINVAAAALLPPGYDVCERHCNHFDETEVDEDGVWTIPLAECGVCDTLYDLSALFDAEEPNDETEYSKEDAAEFESPFVVVGPEEDIPASLFDLFGADNNTRGEA